MTAGSVDEDFLEKDITMKDTWYGDRADLMKWGTLVQLARREELGRIV